MKILRGFFFLLYSPVAPIAVDLTFVKHVSIFSEIMFVRDFVVIVGFCSINLLAFLARDAVEVRSGKHWKGPRSLGKRNGRGEVMREVRTNRNLFP